MSDHATTDTREIIVEILLSLEKGQDFSHKLMKAVLDKYDYLDSREKAFIKRVTEGTIERQLELDYYLDRFSSVPVRKMKPLIRCLLRMSTYQILYMDAVPDSAVCNEACKLAAKRGFRTLKGFVNAVLRNISRSKEQMPLPDPGDTVKYLSIKYSMPEWIVNLWLPAYGREGTETLLAGLLAIHPVSLRFSTELTEEERGALAEGMQKAGVSLCISGGESGKCKCTSGICGRKIYRTGCQFCAGGGSGRHSARQHGHGSVCSPRRQDNPGGRIRRRDGACGIPGRVGI